MKRTKDQNIRLHALIGKLGIDKKEKADLVSKHTKGRTESSADMYMHECNSLMNELQVMANLLIAKTPDEKKAENQRMKLFSIGHELKWNSEQVKSWVLKYGYKHKDINKYTLQELPTLITQFENVLKDKIHASK